MDELKNMEEKCLKYQKIFKLFKKNTMEIHINDIFIENKGSFPFHIFEK